MEHEKIAELKEKISELEKKLLQKEDQERAHVAKISKLENSLKAAKRKTDELEAVEKAFLKVGAWSVSYIFVFYSMIFKGFFGVIH